MDISFTVLCVFVCTVTDFSDEDKACSVKFCQAVHRRPRQGISHFGELSSHRSPEPDESASAPPSPRRSQRLPFGARTHACAVREIVRRVVVASACADIRQSPKTDVLVKYFTHTHTQREFRLRRCCTVLQEFLVSLTEISNFSQIPQLPTCLSRSRHLICRCMSIYEKYWQKRLNLIKMYKMSAVLHFLDL